MERKRRLSDLKSGQPHLLVVPPDQVLRTALSLYMEDPTLPMPTPEEILICNQHTTAEQVSTGPSMHVFTTHNGLYIHVTCVFYQVNLLWQRAVCDPGFRRIFCLVHAEKLSYQTVDKTLRALTEVIQGKTGIYQSASSCLCVTSCSAEYNLVIVCSSCEEDKSPMISKLHLYRRPYVVSSNPAEYRRYLESHFINEEQPLYQQVREMASIPHLSASVVDPNG